MQKAEVGGFHVLPRPYKEGRKKKKERRKKMKGGREGRRKGEREKGKIYFIYKKKWWVEFECQL
jgi:hypothetical protein